MQSYSLWRIAVAKDLERHFQVRVHHNVDVEYPGVGHEVNDVARFGAGFLGALFDMSLVRSM